MSTEPSLFKRLMHRTLKVHILTYYASLFVLSFAAIFGYAFYEDWKTLIGYSRYTAGYLGGVIMDKVNEMADSVEDSVETSASLLPNSGILGKPSPVLIDYLFKVLDRDPNLFSFYMAMDNGDFVQAVNASYATSRKSFNDDKKLLQPQVEYALRVLNHQTNPPSETWSYYDKNHTFLYEESITQRGFDPRSRPWYKDALKSDGYVWTRPYLYNEMEAQGVTCAKRIVNKEGKLIGVMGADVVLQQLASFLEKQNIGKTGRAFILDEKKEIAIPSSGLSDKNLSSLKPDILQKALAAVEKQGEDIAYFSMSEGVYEGYLIYYQAFPKGFEEGWSLMMVASFSDVFSSAISTQYRILALCLFIVIVTAILVYYFSRRISQPIANLSKETDKIRHFDLSSDHRETSNIVEITMMDHSINALKVAMRSFSRYVPKLVVKELINQGKDLVLGGEKKELVVLFTDIANFTTISEELPPDVLTELLESYFDLVSKTFLEHQGTIDKYIGDGIMAFWGAPVPMKNADLNACIASLKAQKRLKEFNDALKQKQLPILFTRIGIHSGVATVGNFGTTERMNYTAMGDVVNTASRLQGANKPYQTSILISDDLYQRVKEQMLARPLDVIEVKGKHNKIKVYELMASSDNDPDIGASAELIELQAAFTKAYDHFEQKNLEEAKKLFSLVLEKFPNDYPTKVHLERIEKENS